MTSENQTENDDTNLNGSNAVNGIASEKSLKQYWLFLSGELISLLGSSVVQFALIWWLTITSKADPRYANQTGLILSLASIAGFAPFVITSLFAGVLVDRWNRKWVIGIADGTEAFLTVILIVMFYINFIEIPYLLIILALRAIAQGFQNPAVQAIIPIMVPRSKFTTVNSLNYLFNGIIFLIGPIVGATLIGWLGLDSMGNILWVDVITFLIAIVPLLIIHIPDITKAKREAKDQLSFKTEFLEGIGFIKQKKGLLSLLTTFTILNIMTTPVFMLLPLIVIDKNLINGDAQTLAIIMAVMQAGSIFSSAILSKWTPFRNNVNGVIFGQIAIYFGIFLLSYGSLTGNLPIVYIAVFIDGMTTPIANVHSQNIWQYVVPPELQGRVMSVRMVIAWIMIPVAQFFGGFFADIIGPINVFLIGGTIGLFFIVYAWFMTGLPRVEKTLGLEKVEFSQESTLEGTGIVSK